MLTAASVSITQFLTMFYRGSVFLVIQYAHLYSAAINIQKLSELTTAHKKVWEREQSNACLNKYFWAVHGIPRIWICEPEQPRKTKQWYFTPPNTPNTLPVLGPHPLPVYLHWWSDWTFTCCKTVDGPYSPVTVLLGIAIRCFVLLTCFPA